MADVFDTHNHLWKLNDEYLGWIDESMQAIKKDFIIQDLEDVLSANGVVSSILVQAQPIMSETEELLRIADDSELVKGVVGWVDVKKGKEIKRDLAELLSVSKSLKGIRYISQGLPAEHLTQAGFIDGVREVGERGLVYELLITTGQLSHAEQLVAACPETTFVIEHMAKPNIKQQEIAAWKDGITTIATRHANVYCKLSGLVTEADWDNWKHNDFAPYMTTVLQAFGEDRVIFGSDWPVCSLAADYSQVLELALWGLERNPDISVDKVMFKNAATLYQV